MLPGVRRSRRLAAAASASASRTGAASTPDSGVARGVQQTHRQRGSRRATGSLTRRRHPGTATDQCQSGVHDKENQPPLANQTSPPCTSSEAPPQPAVAAATVDCAICMEPIGVQGELNSCEHGFCFTCISLWAEKANVCPLCKRRFTSITKKHVRERGNRWDSSDHCVFTLQAGPPTPTSGSGRRRRGSSRRVEKVRVRKRDYRLTESDEEWYYWDDLAGEEYYDEDDDDGDDEVGPSWWEHAIS